ILLGLIVVSEIAIGLPQFGISQREPGIRLHRSLKTLQGFEMISLALQFQPFVVVPKSLQGVRRRLKRLGAELLKNIAGKREVLLDGLGELRDGRDECILVDGLSFYRNCAVVLEVSKSGVDADMVA